MPEQVRPIITWWIENIHASYKLISHGPPTLTLFSDASQTGWGAYNKTEKIRTGGKWSLVEQDAHINILELKACQLCLLTFCKNVSDTHVRIYTDNTTCLAYINKFGGCSPELDSIARDIWFWCINRHIHISAAHIPGVDNWEADEESRADNENDDTEWCLNADTFKAIYEVFPTLTIDLFASRLNNKLDKYVSRRPDPKAFAIDAFSLTWTNDHFFIFPPFSLLPPILQKIEEDNSTAVVIAPLWPTQSWWPSLLHLVTGQCFRLSNTKTILSLPNKPGQLHPLKKMILGCFPISGKPSKAGECLNKHVNLFLSRGDNQPKSSTMCISQSGFHSAARKLTPLNLQSIMS